MNRPRVLRPTALATKEQGLYYKLLNANMGKDGSMKETLIWIVEGRKLYWDSPEITDCPKQAKICVLLDDNNNILSWALAFKYHKLSSGYVVHTYTPDKYRRRGYGTKVVLRLQKSCGEIYTRPWDPRSVNFYNHVEILITAGLLKKARKSVDASVSAC